MDLREHVLDLREPHFPRIFGGEFAVRRLPLAVLELQREIRRLLQTNRRVVLDFQDIKFVEWNGIEMLKSLASEAVEIVNAPPLIQDLLNEGDGRWPGSKEKTSKASRRGTAAPRW